MIILFKVKPGEIIKKNCINVLYKQSECKRYFFKDVKHIYTIVMFILGRRCFFLHNGMAQGNSFDCKVYTKVFQYVTFSIATQRLVLLTKNP